MFLRSSANVYEHINIKIKIKIHNNDVMYKEKTM